MGVRSGNDEIMCKLSFSRCGLLLLLLFLGGAGLPLGLWESQETALVEAAFQPVIPLSRLQWDPDAGRRGGR